MLHRFTALRGIGVSLLMHLIVASLAAQTVDEPRLVAGLAVGRIGGKELWMVANQPVASTYSAADLFDLHRTIATGLTLSGHFTYFPSTHLGIVGELAFLGLRTSDACSLVEHHGDPTLTSTCDSVAQKYRHGASTAIVQTGVTWRLSARARFQPYLKATAGLAFVPTSSLALASTYWHGFPPGRINQQEIDSVFTIYTDPEWSPIRPSWVAGAGFTLAGSFGMQLRVEARETWVMLQRPTGPTSGQGLVPPAQTEIAQFASVMIGFDLVFAKRRGQRY